MQTVTWNSFFLTRKMRNKLFVYIHIYTHKFKAAVALMFGFNDHDN